MVGDDLRCVLCHSAGQIGQPCVPGERLCEMHLTAATQAAHVAEEMTGQASTWTPPAASALPSNTQLPPAVDAHPTATAAMADRSQVISIPRDILMEADQVDAVGPDGLQDDDAALPVDAEHVMQPAEPLGLPRVSDDENDYLVGSLYTQS